MAYRPPVKYSQGLKDKATAAAVRNLEVWAEQTANQLSKGGTGGVSLPIAMSDVTGLAAALAAKASLSHTHAPTDITGGTNGDVLTISGGVPVWAPPSGGGGTPSVSVSIASTAGGTVNVSTLGTVDWFIMDSMMDPPRAKAGKQIHSKILGGQIKNTFEWSHGGYTNTISDFTGGIGATMQSNAGDDTYGGTNNSNLCAYIFTTGAAIPLSSTSTGWGFSFRTSACATARTLTVLFGHYSCKLRVSARLADGSASGSAVSDSLSMTQVARTATITYSSAYPVDLIVQADMFDNYTGDPNIGFGCAYVG